MRRFVGFLAFVGVMLFGAAALVCGAAWVIVFFGHAAADGVSSAVVDQGVLAAFFLTVLFGWLTFRLVKAAQPRLFPHATRPRPGSA